MLHGRFLHPHRILFEGPGFGAFVDFAKNLLLLNLGIQFNTRVCAPGEQSGGSGGCQDGNQRLFHW